MSFAERMQHLFERVGTCRALAVSDIGTSTVLRVCAEAGATQEQHDALLAEASLCLGPSGVAALSEAGAGPGPVRRAVVIAAAETRVHLRNDPHVEEVACARCAPGLPDPRLEQGMGDLLGGDG